MSAKKILAIVGATGAQGGGLARAILHDPHSEFAVRALTRDPHSAGARALAQLGAEVVAADLDDAASLTQALQGAYGAYFVTFFWAHFSPQRELAEARNLAQAAQAAGLQHVIWSTLEDTRRWVPLPDERLPTLQGSYKVPHFDAKGEANAYFAAAGVPTTYLLTSFYWENFIYFGMGPQPTADGQLAITFPLGDKRMACIAAEDIGRCAYGIFQQGRSLVGQTVGIAGDLLTGQQLAEGLTAALGRPVRYQDVDPAAYRSLGFPGADDLGNMFQFYRDYEAVFVASRDVARARQLNPALQSFADWLADNAARIPLL